MPSHQRFPHARRRRRYPVRAAIVAGLATIVAVGVLVVGPALLPQVPPPGPAAGQLAGQVSGQEPTSGAASPSPSLLIAEALPAPPSASPSSPPPIPRRTTPGIPPERIMAERDWTTAPDPSILTGYRWPLAHPRLTLPFGPTPWGSRVVDGRTFHDGVDLASFCSDKILAAHDGVVLAAGRHYDDLMGWVGDLSAYYARLDKKHLWYALPIVVVIDDGNGYRSMYAHMWKLSVKVGDHVRAGQAIGLEGMTGRASGCHLHYGLFSPWETATFGILPKVVKDMKLPGFEIARIDPLSILPRRAGLNAPAKPKPTPAPGATPIP